MWCEGWIGGTSISRVNMLVVGVWRVNVVDVVGVWRVNLKKTSGCFIFWLRKHICCCFVDSNFEFFEMKFPNLVFQFPQVLFTGSGSTSAVALLIRILNLSARRHRRCCMYLPCLYGVTVVCDLTTHVIHVFKQVAEIWPNPQWSTVSVELYLLDLMNIIQIYWRGVNKLMWNWLRCH